MMRLPWVVAFSTRIYQCLLNLGPAEFRHEFGASMVQVFRQCCHDAYKKRGAVGVMCLWLPLFSEAVVGMLAEHACALGYTDERILRMLRTQRRSMITIFFAFVLFGLPWLFYQGVTDPSLPWNALVRVHPELDVLYSMGRTAGEIAFLTMLVAGLPIIFVAVKQALASRRRDIVALFGLAACMTLFFVVGTILLFVIPWLRAIDANGGIFAVLSLLWLITVVAALALLVARSELSERVLRFALWCGVVVALAMLVALVSIGIEMELLAQYAQSIFGNAAQLSVLNIMSIVALLLACFALWRGFRARRLILV